MFLRRPERHERNTVLERFEEAEREAFERIRCPLCEWRPSPSSTWACYAEGTPEPPFQWCGTSWNTFATRGRCPGCQHQWRGASGLGCGGRWLPEGWVEWEKRRGASSPRRGPR